VLLYLEPLLDQLPNEGPAARVALLVRLVEEPRQLDLRLLLRVAGLLRERRFPVRGFVPAETDRSELPAVLF
jgi:hypothetical protein